jgi:hypothetical protein
VTLTDAAHPADSALLAALHRESLPEASTIREHVAGCGRCSARWHELELEDAAVAALLCDLDHDVPAGAVQPWLQSRPRRFRRALLTAGAAATLAVAAAAAIIPDAPLHRWLVRAHDTAPMHALPPGAPTSAAPSVPLASGLSIRAPRSLTVHFRRDQTVGMIEITRSNSSDVTFRSRGGTTAYRLSAGQVSIDNQRPAQAYLIDLPASVQRLRIVVGRRELMRWPDDSIRLTRGHESRPTRLVLDLAHPGVP